MSLNSFRLVLDTNILVRGFINTASDSGRILELSEQRRIAPLLSNQVVREYPFGRELSNRFSDGPGGPSVFCDFGE